MSVCPSTKSFFDFDEIWYVCTGRRLMHDGMQYDSIQGQGHEPLKVENTTIFKCYFLPHLQWGLANEHGFLNLCTIPNAYRGRIFDFCSSFCHVTLKLAVSRSRLSVLYGANFLYSQVSYHTNEFQNFQ